MERLEEVDLGCIGGLFTWKNHRSVASLIKERLDYDVCNPQWCIEFPKVGVVNLPILGSNLMPILLDTALEREKLSFPFHFLTVWTKKASYEEVIQGA